MSVLEAATEAANRIIHGDAGQDDVQLVAGVLLQILAQPRVSSELRTGTEWVPLEKEVVE
jgi:hypothetical protein